MLNNNMSGERALSLIRSAAQQADAPAAGLADCAAAPRGRARLPVARRGAAGRCAVASRAAGIRLPLYPDHAPRPVAPLLEPRFVVLQDLTPEEITLSEAEREGLTKAEAAALLDKKRREAQRAREVTP